LSERERLDVLGCGVDVVDKREALASIEGFLASARAAHVVTFGAEMAMRAQVDAAYRGVINSADLVVADTVGIVWASRVLGRALRERVAGIDLVEALLESVDVPVYFLGAAGGVAADAAAALARRHARLRIAGCRDGYFARDESAAIAETVRASGARIALIALGFPRQEFFIWEHLVRMGPCVCIGVGGAFDVWAGRVRRAPERWRRAGLEWLYRLITQPQRLGRQLALPAFAIRVLIQASRRR
jgi:N-acetylglucosaminyldiphosphoundecaprenol N-acetyl-beta-D-mannosaminyltransferase